MARKPGQSSQMPQPPEFTTPLPSGLTVVEQLEDGAAHTRQRWADLALDGQSADDLSLDQILLRSVSMRETRLTIAQLIDCRAENCDLAGLALQKPYLRRVELAGCRLSGAQWLDADLEDVRLTGCSAGLLRLWGATARRVRFEQCALQEASFDGSNLSGVAFIGCDLTRADFRNTTLRGADLRGSTISGLQIGARDLVGAIIDPEQALQLIELFGVTVRPTDA